MNQISSCLKFKKKCELSKENFKNKLLHLKNSGKIICGYAAAAKSSTVLNYCKIGNEVIDFIADSTKEKIGKFSPGMHIPIVSIDYFRRNQPDIAVIFSWNHKNEILEKEKNYSKKVRKWITHVKK